MARRNRRMLTSQFLSCQSGGRNATGRSCDAFCRRARASDYHQQLIAPGKQPQPPFAVVQQTWSERQLQL